MTDTVALFTVVLTENVPSYVAGTLTSAAPFVVFADSCNTASSGRAGTSKASLLLVVPAPMRNDPPVIELEERLMDDSISLHLGQHEGSSVTEGYLPVGGLQFHRARNIYVIVI